MSQTEYENLPTSPAIDDLYYLLTAAPRISILPDIHTVSPGRSVRIVEESPNARTISFQKGDTVIRVFVPNLDSLERGTMPARNVLLMLLILMAKQNMAKRGLTGSRIEFQLKDLVDAGFYSSNHTARAGLESAMTILQSIQISWSTKKKHQTHGRVLFTGFDIVNGICSVAVNPEMDWSFVLQYYTLMPIGYATLPQKSRDLLFYVMYLLRQNLPRIIETQSFAVKLSTVQIRLALPHTEDTKNPLRDILQSIRTAVEQINQAIPSGDLRLEIVAPEGSKTIETLRDGKLVAHIGGELLSLCGLLQENLTKRTAIAAKTR